MGRLTLNVVVLRAVRARVSASASAEDRRLEEEGIWMGGVPPPGSGQAAKLIIVEIEGKPVRLFFALCRTRLRRL